ncbi:MAG: aldo/keto reductase [Actinomycetes bacterium]
MRYAMLGRTGLVVSRLAFGAMTFTAGNKDIGAVYKVGADLADTLVGRALERGVNFFDTADGYAGGESETLLGRTLRTHRDDVVIATKVGFRTGPALTQAGLSRRHICWSVEQSLKRLGTDWIDVYIAHREDPYTPLEETLSALDAIVRSGKVRLPRILELVGLAGFGRPGDPAGQRTRAVHPRPDALLAARPGCRA